jgi:hypothetical protein
MVDESLILGVQDSQCDPIADHGVLILGVMVEVEFTSKLGD